MNFLGLRHPFFLPLWRRVLTVAFVAGWTVVELLGGSPFWTVLFGAITAWCAYEFFIAFDPENYTDKD